MAEWQFMAAARRIRPNCFIPLLHWRGNGAAHPYGAFMAAAAAHSEGQRQSVVIDVYIGAAFGVTGIRAISRILAMKSIDRCVEEPTSSEFLSTIKGYLFGPKYTSEDLETAKAKVERCQEKYDFDSAKSEAFDPPDDDYEGQEERLADAAEASLSDLRRARRELQEIEDYLNAL